MGSEIVFPVAADGRTVAVLGAGAEIGPLAALLSWGARVAAVDLPRPGIWEGVLATARRGRPRRRATVSMNVAPPTRTRSVTKNRALSALTARTGRFPRSAARYAPWPGNSPARTRPGDNGQRRYHQLLTALIQIPVGSCHG
jgi:hypothetical protein